MRKHVQMLILMAIVVVFLTISGCFKIQPSLEISFVTPEGVKVIPYRVYVDGKEVMPKNNRFLVTGLSAGIHTVRVDNYLFKENYTFEYTEQSGIVIELEYSSGPAADVLITPDAKKLILRDLDDYAAVEVVVNDYDNNRDSVAVPEGYMVLYNNGHVGIAKSARRSVLDEYLEIDISGTTWEKVLHIYGVKLDYSMETVK